MVDQGAKHTVVQSSDGKLWGFGNNFYGQLASVALLGDETYTPSRSNPRVLSPNITCLLTETDAHIAPEGMCSQACPTHRLLHPPSSSFGTQHMARVQYSARFPSRWTIEWPSC